VWRVAPLSAALALVAAAGHRWLGVPTIVPIVMLVVAAAALVGYSYWVRRERPITDAVAAHVDADAQLGGELRSASWFAAATARDAWADFHIERAAERVRVTDWPQLYPSIRQPRAWAATAVLAAAALGLSATLPVRAIWPGAAIAAKSGAGATSDANGASNAQALILPPELQKKLEELLAGIESGKFQGDDAVQRAGELKDLLALLSKQLDPEMRKQLEQAALQAAARGGQKPVDAKALAQRAKRDASDINTPAELRKALDELASELAKDGEPPNGEAASQSASANAPSEGTQGDQSGQQQAGGQPSEASIQFARDSAGGGASQAMMVSAGLSSNDPRPGQGGNRGGQPPELTSDIAQALRRETVEANSDTTGENVTTETRRKTEQGRASAS
jgi:hypothetical protein